MAKANKMDGNDDDLPKTNKPNDVLTTHEEQTKKKETKDNVEPTLSAPSAQGFLPKEPTPVHPRFFPKKIEKPVVYPMPTIVAISGKKVTISDGRTVYISGTAEVYLNGEKVTLAALDNEDTIVLGNGKMNDRTNTFEFNKVDATRECE